MKMIKEKDIIDLEENVLKVIEGQMKKPMPANDKAELDNVVNFLCDIIKSNEYGYASEETVRGFISKVYYAHPKMDSRVLGKCMFRDMFQLMASAAKHYNI